MKWKTIAVAALAVLVVGAGAVMAVPGSAADQAQTHANDHSSGGSDDPDEATQGTDDHENRSEHADNASEQPAVAQDAPDRRGPPTDMPSQVPGHVLEIHETINSWLSGDLDGSLGDALSDLLGGTDNADAAQDDGDDPETPTPEPHDGNETDTGQ